MAVGGYQRDLISLYSACKRISARINPESVVQKASERKLGVVEVITNIVLMLTQN